MRSRVMDIKTTLKDILSQQCPNTAELFITATAHIPNEFTAIKEWWVAELNNINHLWSVWYYLKYTQSPESWVNIFKAEAVLPLICSEWYKHKQGN